MWMHRQIHHSTTKNRLLQISTVSSNMAVIKLLAFIACLLKLWISGSHGAQTIPMNLRATIDHILYDATDDSKQSLLMGSFFADLRQDVPHFTSLSSVD